MAAAPGGAIDVLLEYKAAGVIGALGVAGGPIDVMTRYVETGAPLLANLGQTPVKYERIGVPQLAAMAAAADCVLRF